MMARLVIAWVVFVPGSLICVKYFHWGDGRSDELDRGLSGAARGRSAVAIPDGSMAFDPAARENQPPH